jgi:hypothetical protein
MDGLLGNWQTLIVEAEVLFDCGSGMSSASAANLLSADAEAKTPIRRPAARHFGWIFFLRCGKTNCNRHDC